MSVSLVSSISYHIIPYHIVNIKWHNHLKVGTDKPKQKVKMQSVLDDDVRKRLPEKPHFAPTCGPNALTLLAASLDISLPYDQQIVNLTLGHALPS